MNKSHFVLGILGALLTGINSAAPLLSSGAQTWVHVGTAVFVPVLVFLGITSVSALAPAAAAAPAAAPAVKP